MFLTARGGRFFTLQKANKAVRGSSENRIRVRVCAGSHRPLVRQRCREVQGSKTALGLPTFATGDKWHVTGGAKIVKF